MAATVIFAYLSVDQSLKMTRSVVRQIPNMATNDGAGDAVAFPSMGLPEPPSVEPMAVASAAASAADEDDLVVTFPVDVAIGKPAFDGKFWPVEYGWLVDCEFGKEDVVLGGTDS
jgi:hypothetical protein